MSKVLSFGNKVLTRADKTIGFNYEPINDIPDYYLYFSGNNPGTAYSATTYKDGFIMPYDGISGKAAEILNTYALLDEGNFYGAYVNLTQSSQYPNSRITVNCKNISPMSFTNNYNKTNELMYINSDYATVMPWFNNLVENIQVEKITFSGSIPSITVGMSDQGGSYFQFKDINFDNFDTYNFVILNHNCDKLFNLYDCSGSIKSNGIIIQRSQTWLFNISGSGNNSLTGASDAITVAEQQGLLSGTCPKELSASISGLTPEQFSKIEFF